MAESNPLHEILIDPRVVDLFSKQPEQLAKLVNSWMRICIRYVHPDINPEFGTEPLKQMMNRFIEAYTALGDRQLSPESWEKFAQELLDNPADRMAKVRLYSHYTEEIAQLRRQVEHLTNQVRQKEAEGNQRLTDAQIQRENANGTAANQIKLARQVGARSTAKLICLLVGENLPDKKVVMAGKLVPVREAHGRLFISPISYKLWDNKLREAYGFKLIPEDLSRRARKLEAPQRLRSISQRLCLISEDGQMRVQKITLTYDDLKTGKSKAMKEIAAACYAEVEKLKTESGRLWYTRGYVIGSAAETSMASIDILEPGGVSLTAGNLDAFVSHWVQPYIPLAKVPEYNWLVSVKLKLKDEMLSFQVYGFPTDGRYMAPRSRSAETTKPKKAL